MAGIWPARILQSRTDPLDPDISLGSPKIISEKSISLLPKVAKQY